jgi:hypothetical protein
VNHQGGSLTTKLDAKAIVRNPWEQRSDWICCDCGYGAVAVQPPPSCPMCRGSQWELRVNGAVASRRFAGVGAERGQPVRRPLVKPPSTTRATPVTHEASAEAR